MVVVVSGFLLGVTNAATSGASIGASTARPVLIRTILYLALFWLSGPVFALEEGTQTWATFRLQGPVNDSTSWSLRYRERFNEAFDRRILYQYQVIVGHRLPTGLKLSAGYELFRTDVGISENRLFPQMEFSSSVLDLPLRHRLRFELRDLSAKEFGFRDEQAYRLRYLFAHKRELPLGQAYLELRNEFFLSLGEGSAIDPRATQNRIGATLGSPFGDRFRAELRYQYGYTRGDEFTQADHLIQFQFDWDYR